MQASFIRSIVLIMAFLAVPMLRLNGQSESEAEFDSPYNAIENPELRKAILTLVHMEDVPDRLERKEGETPFQFAARQAERANLPVNQQAVSTVLAYINTADFNALPEPLSATLMANIVKVAVSSGSAAHLPQLMKLAHHPDRRIRHALVASDAYAYLPNPPLKLLKECLKVAEEKLPKDIKDEGAREAFDEFDWCVEMFTRYARTQSKRDEARPFVERFYKRYGWWVTRQYEPRFNRSLNGIPIILEPYDPKKAAADAVRRQAWRAAIWVGSVAVLAVLWWVIRKKLRRASARLS